MNIQGVSYSKSLNICWYNVNHESLIYFLVIWKVYELIQGWIGQYGNVSFDTAQKSH